MDAPAVQGGLGGERRFLDRLGDHAALVDRRGLWGEVAGSRLRFDAAGPLSPGAADGMAAQLDLESRRRARADAGPRGGICERRSRHHRSEHAGERHARALRIGWDAASDGSLDAHALTATVLIAL